MEVIRRIVKIPENHEIKIKIPEYVPENEIMEVILVVKKKQDNFIQKIEELKESVKDNLFFQDLSDISDDFKAVDLEG